MIPKPFTQVLIRFGSFFDVPGDAGRDLLEALRLQVARNMMEAYETVDGGWGTGKTLTKSPFRKKTPDSGLSFTLNIKDSSG